jgi:hypothetical protein
LRDQRFAACVDAMRAHEQIYADLERKDEPMFHISHHPVIAVGASLRATSQVLRRNPASLLLLSLMLIAAITPAAAITNYGGGYVWTMADIGLNPERLPNLAEVALRGDHDESEPAQAKPAKTKPVAVVKEEVKERGWRSNYRRSPKFGRRKDKTR